jgi:predicted Zn-dependent protease
LDSQNKTAKQLDRDPSDNRVRALLANVYLGLEDFEAAKLVLTEGKRLQPDPNLDRALAKILALQHDRARQSNQGLDEQLQFLLDAIELESNDFGIYRRLMKFYSDAEPTGEQRVRIRELLEVIVKSDRPKAFAYVALSEISWIEGDLDQATQQMEKAYKLDNKMVLLVNNLAWMLAHADQPDLERAEKLARTAVDQQPQNPRVRDTYGTILMKLQKYQEAALELNLALTGAPNSSEIHEKLVDVYEHLGNKEQAQFHRGQVEQTPK